MFWVLTSPGTGAVMAETGAVNVVVPATSVTGILKAVLLPGLMLFGFVQVTVLPTLVQFQPLLVKLVAVLNPLGNVIMV